MKTREQWVGDVLREADYLINHYHTLNLGHVAKDHFRALLLEVPEPEDEMLKQKML